jgi:hypothetical protein
VSTPERTGTRAIHLAYFVTLGALTVFAYLPEGRVWGLSHWAYSPGWLPLGVAAIGVLAAALVRGLDKRGPGSTPPRLRVAGAGLVLLGGISFVAFRFETHFLGDGYQSLALLAADPPRVKATSPGLGFLLGGLRLALGEDPQQAALRSYRLVSIASGVSFLALAVLFGRILFAGLRERITFVLGVATGGYVLLFFGYVENYALFVVGTAATCWTGLAALTGKVRRV